MIGPDWRERALAVALWGCVGLAIWLRFVSLDHLPGVNGDEAYLGTKVWLFMHGEAVSLRTGSNLPPDPISFGLSALVHALRPVSFVTLRLPSALSGLLTVLAAFALLRRPWGDRTALVVAVLIAALPAHLVYSRFFWEPSQTPLIALLALAAAFRWRIGWSLAAAMMALLVHPTNVFLLPVLAVPLVVGPAGAPTALYRALRARPGRAALFAAVALAGALALGLAWGSGPDGAIARRVLDPGAMALFAERWIGLLDGTSVYTYITGALPDGVALAWHAGWLVFFLLPVGVALVRVPDHDMRCLAVGLAIALPLFYAMAGPEALRPNAERYGLWMTVPHCMLLGLAVAALARSVGWSRSGEAAAACLALVLLLQFQLVYVEKLRTQNSRSENAFMTGEREPKQSAFEWILARRDPARTTRIVAEDWWTYWAIKYLSLGAEPRIEVGLAGRHWDRRFPSDARLAAPTPGRTEIFRVGYVGGAWMEQLRRARPNAARHVVSGYGGAPILEVRP